MLPCVDIAKKIKYTQSQTKLSRKDRIKNMQWSFALLESKSRQKYTTIIIVDDITTTGATINEIAKIIDHHTPKKQLWGLVVWRHNS